MDNPHDTMQQQAIAHCKAGRYQEAQAILTQLLDVLRSHGAPVNSTPTMYWYLRAKHQGNEDAATREFVMLDD